MLDTADPAAQQREAAKDTGRTAPWACRRRMRTPRLAPRTGRSASRVLPGAVTACVIGAAALLAGCATPTQAAIQIGTAYVAQPNSAGTTAAYLVIQNGGRADRLISARTSAGGRVTLSGPAARGSATMRTLPDIRIPAGQTVRLVPNGYHLLITGSGPMRAGRQIVLTLIFARAGLIKVPADVTNPQNGGSSYFIN